MKTNKKLLLSALLLAGVLSLNAGQGAFAASTASQTVTGTLGQMKTVIANGGNIGSSINPDDGTLTTAFSPAFRLTTNSNAATPVRLTATCNTTTVAQNAFSGDGATGTTFLTLTNNTVLPIIAAVTDAQSASPTPATNADVISYAITKPADVPSQLVYTWDNTNKYYNASLTHKGNTDTSLTVPSALPKPNTYSFDDDAGSYQATVTLSFV